MKKKWRERRGSNALTFPRFPRKNARRPKSVNGIIQFLSIKALTMKGKTEMASVHVKCFNHYQAAVAECWAGTTCSLSDSHR